MSIFVIKFKPDKKNSLNSLNEENLTNNSKNESNKTVVYVDLDNTLVDFMSGVKKYPADIVARYERDDNGKNIYDNIPGVFAKMEPMPGAEEAFKFLTEHFDVYILSTAPWNNPSAWSDKLEWVKNHFGSKKEDPVWKRLILSHHKELLRGDYIIDDSTKNGVSEFQGRHIQIGSDEFPDWPTIIEWFKKNVIQ